MTEIHGVHCYTATSICDCVKVSNGIPSSVLFDLHNWNYRGTYPVEEATFVVISTTLKKVDNKGVSLEPAGMFRHVVRVMCYASTKTIMDMYGQIKAGAGFGNEKTTKKDFQCCLYQLATATGMVVSGDMRFSLDGLLSVLVSQEDGTMFSLNEPFKISVHIEKKYLKHHYFHALLSGAQGKAFEITFDTPSSEVDCTLKLVFEGELKPEKYIRMNLKTPWKKFALEGAEIWIEREEILNKKYMNDRNECKQKLYLLLASRNKKFYSQMVEIVYSEKKVSLKVKVKKLLSKGTVVIEREERANKHVYFSDGGNVVTTKGKGGLQGSIASYSMLMKIKYNDSKQYYRLKAIKPLEIGEPIDEIHGSSQLNQEQDLQQQLVPSLKPSAGEEFSHQRERHKRSDDDPQLSLLVKGRQKNTVYSEVNGKLEEFVMYFVKEFEAKLHAYHLILEGETKKAGKFSDSFSEKVGQAVGGATGGLAGLILGSPVAGARAGGTAGKGIARNVGSIIGNKEHTKKVTKLLDLIDLSQKDKTSFRDMLVKAGIDIFQSFEMQFMRVTTDQGPKKAMQLLAKDATNRAVNYYTQNKGALITESVVLGKSKIEPVMGVPVATSKIKTPGFEIKYIYKSAEEKWYTASIYEKVGFVIEGRTSREINNYYEKKDGKSRSDKYGFRRLFTSEKWDKLKDKYRTSNVVKSGQFVDYQYILNSKELEEKSKVILEKINLDDEALTEERLMKIVEEVKEDIIDEISNLKRQTHNYKEFYKILGSIEANLKALRINEYLEEFKQHLEEPIQEYRKITKSIETSQRENRENFSQLRLQQEIHDDDNKREHKKTQEVLERVEEGLEGNNKRFDRIHEYVEGQANKRIKESVWFDVKGPVELFTGRKQELSDLHRKIQRSSGKQTVISQMTSISGLGGIGKTELSRQYIHEHSKSYDDNVIWINGENEGTLIESFHRLAKDELGIRTKDANGKEKDIKSIVGDVYKYFSKKKSLFVFDNAEKNGYFSKFLPVCCLTPDANKPNVLITSRYREWELGIQVVELNELTLEDAVELVKKGLKIKDESEDPEIKKLVKKLQCFPLAIQQAIAYIKHQGVMEEFGISDYLEEYEKRTEILLNSEIFQGIDNDYAKTTLTTWKITLDKIASDRDYGLLALKILDFIAYFAPEKINRKRFLKVADDNEEHLRSAIRLLINYSIVNGEKKFSVLSIHRLVQEVVRLELKGQGREEKNLKEVLRLIEANLERENLDHALFAWNHASKYRELVEEFSELPGYIINQLDDSVRYEDAYLFGVKALKLLSSVLGAEHPSTLSICNSVAEVLHKQAKFKEALQTYKDVLEMRKKVLGEDHLDTLNTHHGMAWTLDRLGQFGEALEIFQEILKKREEIYSVSHSPAVLQDILGTKDRIAWLLINQAKYQEALNILKDVLEKKKLELGPDHTNTLETQHTMAVSLSTLGNTKGALKIFEEIFEKRKKIFGENHPNTLNTQHHIAGELQELREYEKALEIFEKVLERRKMTLGEDHSDTLDSQDGMAFTLLRLGKSEMALDIWKEIFKKREKALGVDQAVIKVKHKMAMALDYIGKTEEALSMYKEVFQKRKEILGVDHTMTLNTQKNMFIMFLEHNNLDIVEFLAKEGADFNVCYDDGETSLTWVAREGKLDAVKILLENGANINEKDNHGSTPLHLAARYGYLDIVTYLIKEKNADFKVKNKYDSTPLHLAARNGHLDVVKYLINEQKADFNVKNKYGITPLHFAARNGRLDTVKYLIDDKKADFNVKNNDGSTTLHLAVKNGHLDTAEYILEKGADILARNNHDTVLHQAVSSGNEEVVRLILKKIKEWFYPDSQQMYKGMNAQDTEGDTPLMWAAETGKTNVAKILIEYRVDLNVKNNDGKTALHWAAKGGFQRVVKLLIDKQADPNIQDKNGKTPLDLAQDKLAQEPENCDFKTISSLLLSITDESKSQLQEEQVLVSLEKCLPGPSSSNRGKREVESGCLFTWEDVDEFNAEKDEKRSLNEIKIDSEKFVKYIQELKEEKRRELIVLANQVEVIGKSRSLVNKLISNEKVIGHLNKVGKVSAIAMHGMMAKNVLVDLLNGNYQGVAVNVGFIAGGQGFAKVVQAASIKGFELASEGKLLLGRSLKAASPFLARGTSAFVVYDLVNQVKEFKNGNEDALVGIVGDGIYLGVDSAEIGIEVAEAFEMLEGVSSVTGPIGATVGAAVFVGTDIYMAMKRVDKIDQIIHLKESERFIEGIRAFIGMQPEKHIEEFIEEKQLSNQLVKQALEYLQYHSDIQRYVFPTGKSMANCYDVPYKKTKCAIGGFSWCSQMRTVTSYIKKCTTKFVEDLNNTVLLNRKRTDIKWSRARPDNPKSGYLFCLPQGDSDPVPSYGSYLCNSAIGLTDSPTNKTGSYTLINLGKGEDYAEGLLDSQNIFVVNNGLKRYHGGNKDDTFILQGDLVKGFLSGRGGINTLDLTGFASNSPSVDVVLDRGDIIYNHRHILQAFGMNKVLGRKNKADHIFSTCDTELLDGKGGDENNSDIIVIENKNCTYKMQMMVRPNTVICNCASKGNFYYILPYSLGSAKIDFFYSNEELSLNNTFMFEYEPTEIENIDVKYVNETLYIITFYFSQMSEKEFNVTISGAKNPVYRFGDNAEIKVGKKGNLYLLQKTHESVDEIIKSYIVVANRLTKMSFFIQSLLSKETVVIGSENYEVIHNNPLYKSHLVGNGGENVYVIDSGDKKLDVAVPEVVIYNLNVKNSVDTIDLKNLVQLAKSRFLNGFELLVLKSVSDLLLKATVTEVKPTKDSSAGKMRKHEYLTVRLKDGVSWYNKIHVIVHNVPMKINLNNNEWSLKPLPLKFEVDKEVIVITSQDVEENTELLTPKEAGNYTFVCDSNSDLMITNAFDANITSNNLCTIVFSKFYEESKMETLSIKFADKEVVLKEHLEEISKAKYLSYIKEEHHDKVYKEVFGSKNMTPDVVMLSDQPMV
ncbi:hypothetical protein J437_LFUL016074 [Ladona fulva]|uniref:NB-ARC domain-containing protein n=1 Tax=Ladona fulva TaxID=123851 RepID=A0A8K0KL49_LADFU|nr:hypothetical protein J437_LFUL016074 [Ladona fulva]